MTIDDLEEQPDPGTTFVVAEVARVKRAAAILGDTEKAIRRRIEDKVWIEGREYHRRGGVVWVDLKGAAAWVRGDAEAA